MSRLHGSSSPFSILLHCCPYPGPVVLGSGWGRGGLRQLSLQHWQHTNNPRLFWKTRQTGLLSCWKPWLLSWRSVLKLKFCPVFAALWLSACAQNPSWYSAFSRASGSVMSVVCGCGIGIRFYWYEPGRNIWTLGIMISEPRWAAYCTSGWLMLISYAVGGTGHFQSICALVCQDFCCRALLSSPREPESRKQRWILDLEVGGPGCGREVGTDDPWGTFRPKSFYDSMIFLQFGTAVTFSLVIRFLQKNITNISFFAVHRRIRQALNVVSRVSKSKSPSKKIRKIPNMLWSK